MLYVIILNYCDKLEIFVKIYFIQIPDGSLGWRVGCLSGLYLHQSSRGCEEQVTTSGSAGCMSLDLGFKLDNLREFDLKRIVEI